MKSKNYTDKKNKFYDRKKILLELIPAMLVIATFVIAFIVYPALPDKVPTHWNSSGKVDNYSGKASIFIIPAIFLAVIILFLILPLMEVYRDNMLKIYNYYYAFKLFFSVFFTVLFLSTVLVNFGYNINVAYIVIAMMGIMFTGLGLTLPRLKRNFMFGIRTGWTLSSDYVWEKTHRLGGILFAILGIMTLVLLFIVKLEVLFIIFITSTLGVSIFLAFYSYYVYRKAKNK